MFESKGFLFKSINIVAINTTLKDLNAKSYYKGYETFNNIIESNINSVIFNVVKKTNANK